MTNTIEAHKGQTIGFGVITRNQDIEGLKTLIACVQPHVDRIYVTVADKEKPSEEMEILAKTLDLDLSYFEWIDDFAAARNFNMSRVTEDWYLWGDTDDVIQGIDKAHALVNTAQSNVQFIMCQYQYAKTATGMVGTEHPKERFIRNNGTAKWKGKLHESCVTDAPTVGVFAEQVIWIHTKTRERQIESTERNIRIIEAEIKEQITGGKVDPRTVFNLGMAYASIAQITQIKEDWEATLKAFVKYLEISGWDQHAYMAWKYAGIAEMALNRPIDALNSFVEAWKLQPSYSDAYSMLGSVWEGLGKIEHAESMYKIALLLGKSNAYASDVETSKLVPLYGLAKIEAMRGDLKNALNIIKEGEKYAGTADGNFAPLKAECKRLLKFQAEARAVVESLKKLPPLKQREAYDALEAKWKSHPDVVNFRKTKNWKKETNGREITIFAYAWEEWNPDTAKTGIGGSEEAIIYLTRELTRLGWNVHVYGQHGTEAKEYEGVMYHPYWEWSPEEETDVFISWRNPEILDMNIKANKKFLWLHDTTPESMVIPRLSKVDKVIVLSEAHASLYPNVPPEKLMLSANGIIPEHFNQEVERNPHQIAYVSAPDRGIGCLLRMWPEIKKQVPDATLVWAYGWNTFDKIQAANPHAMAFKKELQDLMKQDGCTELGRIGHEEVAKTLLSSGVWAYPTEFYEIFCISAVKAQAAGAIPVCTAVGALINVVEYGTQIIGTDIYQNEEMQKAFVDQVVKDLLNPPDRKEMMDWARSRWTWANVAEQWDEEFKAGEIL